MFDFGVNCLFKTYSFKKKSSPLFCESQNAGGWWVVVCDWLRVAELSPLTLAHISDPLREQSSILASYCREDLAHRHGLMNVLTHL